MTKEDSAIRGRAVHFASLGPTEWMFVHGAILIAWTLLIARDALIRMVETARGAELELSTPVVTLLFMLAAALLAPFVMLGHRAAREKSAPTCP